MERQIFGEVEISTYESPHIDKVNLNDVRDVVTSLSVVAKTAFDYRYGIAEKYFDIGCLVGKSDTGISYREYGRMLGMPYRSVLGYKQVAEALGYDKKRFFEAMDGLEEKTWTTLYRKYCPAKRVDHRRTVTKLKAIVGQLLRSEENDETTHRQKLEIISIRNMITRYCPADSTLKDKNYLPYSPCCCCGEKVIPPGGFHLREYGKGYIKYPICPECENEGRAAEPDRILKLYATYALNMENLVFRITNDGNKS